MKVFIIAGPNGAGKTTFAKFFLKNYPDIKHYLNADILASGIAPLKPELAAVEAGRILLKQMSHLAEQKVSFAFETTLSAKNYLRRIDSWKKKGYHVEIIFLSLPNADFAIERVRQRVKQGGHNIPADVIRRRFIRGLENLPSYKKLADSWKIYDSSPAPMRLLETSDHESKST